MMVKLSENIRIFRLNDDGYIITEDDLNKIAELERKLTEWHPAREKPTHTKKVLVYAHVGNDWEEGRRVYGITQYEPQEDYDCWMPFTEYENENILGWRELPEWQEG